MTMLVLNL